MTPKGHPEIGVKWIVMIQLMTDFGWKLDIFRLNYDKIKRRKYALLAAKIHAKIKTILGSKTDYPDYAKKCSMDDRKIKFFFENFKGLPIKKKSLHII